MKLLCVNYHYFREEHPGRGIYPLTLAEFSAQVETLAKEYDFVSQEFVANNLDNPSIEGKKCLLTFDDGLSEQMEVFRLLQEKGIPGTFYVSTDAIEKNEVIDVHKIHHVRSMTDDEWLLSQIQRETEVEITEDQLKVADLQYRYDDAVARKVKYLLNFVLSPDQKKQLIDKVFKTVFGNEVSFAKKLYMGIEDLEALDSQGALGSHSASHRPLGVLSEKDASEEIRKSTSFFMSRLGRVPLSISYPYGGPSAIPKLQDEFFKSLGYKFGLTMIRGINSFGDISSAFNIKRVDTNDAPGGKYYKEGYF